MSSRRQRWTIVGQGLAGTCLAWELWWRGAEFGIIDAGRGGSSRVAAGLINPVTGKNFQPSAGIGVFLPVALDFYQKVAAVLGRGLWHPLPVMRLAASEDEWEKMRRKATLPEIRRWLAGDGRALEVPGWHGAFEVTGGGRLDTRAFLDGSRDFFAARDIYQEMTLRADDAAPGIVWCEGAAGLLGGRCGMHRCAKGEILTLRAGGWDETQIRVGAGGWLVPLGGGLFKAGATYEWEQLDELPTAAGRDRVECIATRLGGGGEFEITAHEAGVRPILRRSEPLIGPCGGGQWLFNGLGSKGGLYAPGIARRLADWLLDDRQPEPEWIF